MVKTVEEKVEDLSFKVEESLQLNSALDSNVQQL